MYPPMTDRTQIPIETPALPRWIDARLRSLALISAVAALGGWLAQTLLDPGLAPVAALSVLCIGLWASAVVPEYWTALGLFLVVIVGRLAPPEVILSGFSTSVFWLLFSGLVLGAAIRHTGLSARMAALLAQLMGRRYAQVIAIIALFGMALAFVIPAATLRIMLLLPIVIALADEMGYGPGAKGRTGMVLAAAFGTWAPAFAILPSNVPNMMLAGMAESLYGYQSSFGTYLAMHFPVLGLAKCGLLVAVILWLFPDRAPRALPARLRTRVPLSPAERRLAVLLGLGLCLWLTDSLHHVAPAWVGLGVALVCLWPGSGLTAKDCLNAEINHASLVFVAGILGLGALIDASGLGRAIVEELSGAVGFDAARPVWNAALLIGVSTLIAIVTNLPGVPTVMTPMAGDLATLTGLPLPTVLMTQVPAYSNALLPHQAPPLVLAAQVGRLPSGALVRLCLVMFALTLLVLTPLDLLWWRIAGLL